MKIKVACIHYREWRILSEAEIYKPHMYQMGGQVKQAIVYYDREREREKERERERERHRKTEWEAGSKICLNLLLDLYLVDFSFYLSYFDVFTDFVPPVKPNLSQLCVL